jgi:hypothetical protein
MPHKRLDLSTEDRMPDFLCFNPDGRRFAEWYGVAFYDLPLQGKHAKAGARIKPGDRCLVATRATGINAIEFGWYIYLHDKTLPDATGPREKARVLFGRHEKTEHHPKDYAVRTLPYSKFFKKDGSFKTGLCVLRG